MQSNARARNGKEDISWCRTATKHFKQSEYRFAQLFFSCRRETRENTTRTYAHTQTHLCAVIPAVIGQSHSTRDAAINLSQCKYTQKFFPALPGSDIVFVSESRSGTRNWSPYLHTLFIDSSDCIMCELLTEFLRYAKWEEERSVLRPAMSALSFCCFGCRKTDFLFLSMTRAIFMLDRYRDHSCSHIDLNMLI